MAFIAADIVGILLALPILAALVCLPGRLLAEALDFPGFAAGGRLARAGASLVVGCATMPVLLDLAGHAGPRGMVVLAAGLSLAGAIALLRSRAVHSATPTESSLFIAVALIVWIIFAIAMLVDWPEAGGLHRSMQSADHVKHAAATWIIANTGAPPDNPTFFEPGAKAAYYYFFYNLTATVALIGAPLGIVARQAAWAGVILAGVALASLIGVVYARAGLERALGVAADKPLAPWLLTLLLTTGLDMLPVVLVGGLVFHVWITQYEFWDTQVTSWLNSVIWVPHHVLGLVAAWVGFMALARDGAAPGWRRAALAGLAFASCAGMSIYVAMGAAATALVFVIWLAVDRRFVDVGGWLGAGVFAAIIAAPWLVSLLAGRPVGAGDAPIAFEIRALPILDVVLIPGPGRALARLLAAPFAYAIEFGVYLLGAVVFWKQAGRRGLAGDLARLLVVATAVSLLIATFLRSAVLDNDLGWRVVLFAQLATLLWTLAALRGGLVFAVNDARKKPFAPLFWACLALGFAADIYGVVQLRRYPEEPAAEIALAPDERAAWGWMVANLPPTTIVQENPDRPRAFAYGLYGHFRESVSDHFNGILFGSTKDAVEARIRALAPLFTDRDLNVDDAMEIATRASIDVLVFRAVDPAFTDRDSWVWRIDALHANERMRVIRVRKRALAERTP